ncbi:corrinoid protein [Desulfoluna spongiiphila]|uniref:5-methyltetrahydrofolate--homocysteine methyltransferase n=1 Tax=Desulfoluna spongiiphila TaxID=419481 RepID=A0A1G5BL70_9BACT|nr:corrinoid protein [Desulfoluna spongiiphila]SCX90931.1 5-methyltetrahydrofolate--homocysteine methyltransferase [Desulfoluna spongiiphila]
MSNHDAIMASLMSGDTDQLIDRVNSALDAGIPAVEILNEGLISTMDLVGEKMESGEMFIPEVIMCAQAMTSAVEILKPLLGEGDNRTVGTLVIGTVKGDLHDIGKNLVRMMLESSGFGVVDLGVDVEPQAFVEAVRKHDADIVALSALLTTTMPMLKKTMDAFEEAGLRNSVKILIGGAPVNQGFADEIGADGYAPDAGSASKLAKAVVTA